MPETGQVTVSEGSERIAWAGEQMPVLAQIRERFSQERPLAGISVAACLHVTAETANLMLCLQAAGAHVALCSANPLATQHEVAAALASEHGVDVRVAAGESFQEYQQHVGEVVESARARGRWLTVDDGADLLIAAHQQQDATSELIGGTEETTTGLLRLRRLASQHKLRVPVLAVNEARTERALNDRHGTGQSALDGIVRATNVLLAGQTVVVLGYGWAGQGIAERARGAGAAVIVCEVEPLRALEARMAGYQVMPAVVAAAQGDLFITVTGSTRVLGEEHFAVMKDGALLANAGHFNVEIDLDALNRCAASGPRTVRPLIEQFVLSDSRRLNLLAQGRVVNLLAGDGHPAAVMDVSFALQALSLESLVTGEGELAAGVHQLPESIDREVASLKLAALGVQIDRSTAAQDEYRQSWR